MYKKILCNIIIIELLNNLMGWGISSWRLSNRQEEIPQPIKLLEYIVTHIFIKFEKFIYIYITCQCQTGQRIKVITVSGALLLIDSNINLTRWFGARRPMAFLDNNISHYTYNMLWKSLILFKTLDCKEQRIWPLFTIIYQNAVGLWLTL